jgi:hypothetical protein
MIHNRWSDQSGSPSAVTTVAISGPITDLPPQRIGTTEIRVRAAGYGDAGPILVQVDQSLRDRIIEVPMTRSTETADMVILIDGVSPAAGAEIAAFSNDQMMWHGSADGEGHIAIPESVTRARVVVRHPSAASDVVLFGKLSGPQRLSLARAAPPLVVKVVRSDGTRMGPAAAKLSIWLTGGVRLTGAEAAFATWSLAATSPDGTFIARGLHPKSLRLLATRQASFAQIQTGTFDGLASTIPYPWPTTYTIQVIDE